MREYMYYFKSGRKQNFIVPEGATAITSGETRTHSWVTPDGSVIAVEIFLREVESVGQETFKEGE